MILTVSDLETVIGWVSADMLDTFYHIGLKYVTHFNRPITLSRLVFSHADLKTC